MSSSSKTLHSSDSANCTPAASVNPGEEKEARETGHKARGQKRIKGGPKSCHESLLALPERTCTPVTWLVVAQAAMKRAKPEKSMMKRVIGHGQNHIQRTPM